MISDEKKNFMKGIIATPRTGVTPLTVSFSVDGPDPTAKEYIWDFGDGSPTATGLTVEHTFNGGRGYDLTLTERLESSGNTIKRNNFIVVARQSDLDKPFPADFDGYRLDGEYPSGPAPLTILFSGITAEGVMFAWDFGDGQTVGEVDLTTGKIVGGIPNSPIIAHEYKTPGTYTVKLRCRNEVALLGFVRTNYIRVT